MSAAGRFYFSLPVWGETYVARFLDLALPTWLAPGNLGAFPWAGDSVCEIFTRAEDAERMRADPRLAALGRKLALRFHPIDALIRESKFGVFTDAQRIAVGNCDALGAAHFIMTADLLYSDGSIRHAAESIVAGRQAVMVPGLRSVLEDMAPILRAAAGADGAIALPGRALARLGLDRLHPQSRGWFWDSESFDRLPPYLLWRAGADAVLLRGFPLHPLAIKPVRPGIALDYIFDQDYLAAAAPDPGRIEVVADSDRALLFEVTERDRFDAFIAPHRADVADLAYWAEWAFNRLHRQFGRRSVRIHAGTTSEDEWAAAEAQAEATVEAILKLLAMPDWYLFQVDRRRLRLRLRRRYRFADAALRNLPLVMPAGDIGQPLALHIDALKRVASPRDALLAQYLAVDEWQPAARLTDPAARAQRLRQHEAVCKLLGTPA
ncbi:MAG: hypothetical protein FJX46_00915 [Alphaproteobacteria bacterium]|nr:hypothetical protein [Alphaproteobacteria bacterium]